MRTLYKSHQTHVTIPLPMQTDSVEPEVLFDVYRLYQTLIDKVEHSVFKVSIPFLTRLSMVDKETRERVTPLLKKSLKWEGFLYPEPIEKLLLFDANRHYMTIQHIDDGAFKVRAAGVTYLLRKGDARMSYFNASGDELEYPTCICEIFPQIIEAFKIHERVRKASKRHQIPVKMPSVWFKNVDNTPDGRPNRFCLIVHADLKQTKLMAEGRRRFDELHRKYGNLRPGKGVRMELRLQCIKFD